VARTPVSAVKAACARSMPVSRIFHRSLMLSFTSANRASIFAVSDSRSMAPRSPLPLAAASHRRSDSHYDDMAVRLVSRNTTPRVVIAAGTASEYQSSRSPPIEQAPEMSGTVPKVTWSVETVYLLECRPQNRLSATRTDFQDVLR
jgi:hypothetical protein